MSVKNYLLKNRRRIIKNCVVISFYAAVALAGFLIASETEIKGRAVKEPETLEAGVSEQRTSPDCMAAWEFIYEFCGHKIMARSKITPDMTGLTLKEFENKFKNIKVLYFAPKNIKLQKKIRQYCPDHLILKMYDDILGVFKTDLGKDTPSLQMRISIPYEAIPDEEKTSLFCGKVFNSEDEIDRYVRENIIK